MITKQDLKDAWNKFWFIVWKDDSFKGWLLSILFIFIMIKFILFPTLNLVTGTDLPLAIVESCSMYHSGVLFHNFDSWFSRHEEKYSGWNIEKSNFQDFKMHNGFNKGDILLITRAKSESLQVGDIIVFTVGSRNPIIHRIVNIKDSNGTRIFVTEGDNNNGQLPFETAIREEQIVGKAQVKIVPYFGWIKLIFFEWHKPQSERGFCSEN